MGVRIRFARLGCKNNPFYRIIVTDSLSPRDGRQLEVLGFFNPLSGKDDPKRMALKYERVKYWLSVGAQPSEPVERILLRAGLLPPPPVVGSGRKSSGSDLSSEKPEQPGDAESWASLSIPLEGGPVPS